MNENEIMNNGADEKDAEKMLEPVIEPITEDKKPEYKYVRIPYTGGTKVICPQCKSDVTTKFCPYCGKDMSLCYTVKQLVPVETVISEVIPAAVSVTSENAYIPEVNVQAPRKQKRQKKSHFTLALVFTIIGFVLLFAGMIFGAFALSEKINPDKAKQNEIVSPKDKGEEKGIGISEGELDKIKEGMSYAHVSQIAGCDGTMIKNGENLDGGRYYVYIWPMEENETDVICITFINDKVSDIERNRNK